MQKSTWPKWPNWKGPDPVERQIGINLIPEIIQEYGDFKDAMHNPKMDYSLWYVLAYHNLSTFYRFAHAKKCLRMIGHFNENLRNNSVDAFLNFDFFISNFFLSLRSALDTLAAQIHLIFTQDIPHKINLTNISKNAKKYKPLIEKAEQSWYNEFSRYRNHLGHDIFLIRFGNVLIYDSLLYP